jgi:hypothetical protein
LTSGAASEADLIRVVLADANLLYSRVLRDYLLYAADQENCRHRLELAHP